MYVQDGVRARSGPGRDGFEKVWLVTLLRRSAIIYLPTVDRGGTKRKF